MSYNKLIEISFFLSVILSGFYAGTGFFVAMGGNPAIKLMSNNTFAEYWQHTDHFMAVDALCLGSESGTKIRVLNDPLTPLILKIEGPLLE